MKKKKKKNNKSIIAGMTLILAGTINSAIASDYTNIQSDRANHFGIDYPDLDFSGTNSKDSFTNTGTRHHRFGRQTGIGSSYAQTEATTTEAMGGFNYSPTSASPALPTRLATPALQKLDLNPMDASGIDTKIGTIDFRTDFDVPDLGAANSFGTSLSTNTIRNNLKMNNRNKTRNTSVFSIDLLDPSIRP